MSEEYLQDCKFTKGNLERLYLDTCKKYHFRLKYEERVELFEQIRKGIILFVENFIKNKIIERRKNGS